ncbi:MAG TPA: polyketide cyclase, partial [Alphaproteobacteria bacterium]|nr:polyketide cyclase [Alphaproteobacteria bacterium]
MPGFEAKTFMPAKLDAVFEFLDTPAKAGGHMEKPSMMMMGGSMTYETDARGGREVGSVITMGGNFLWLRLSVRETVVEREPPRRKV